MTQTISLDDLLWDAQIVYGEGFSSRLFLRQLTDDSDLIDRDDSITLLTAPYSFEAIMDDLQSLVRDWLGVKLGQPPPTQFGRKTMRLPEALGYLFHRYRTDNIDTKTHFNLVVMTVLNDGSLDDWRWLFAYYGWQQIRDWVADSQNSRALSPEMETFWTRMLLATPRKRDRWAGGNNVRAQCQRW
ncbi:hypothetical protein [Ferrimicrobium sp.]|uniref:DUF6922 domain-containing protein n=1 Tax=Ferrimicrobium sp. TaxID=2926050 RepID=UPI002625619D|nr:hypothetical protein [Ferrimicrobium sp.]